MSRIFAYAQAGQQSAPPVLSEPEFSALPKTQTSGKAKAVIKPIPLQKKKNKLASPDHTPPNVWWDFLKKNPSHKTSAGLVALNSFSEYMLASRPKSAVTYLSRVKSFLIYREGRTVVPPSLRRYVLPDTVLPERRRNNLCRMSRAIGIVGSQKTFLGGRPKNMS